MKKVIRISGITLLTLIVLATSYGIYKYQTDDVLRAMINNDEAKLMYNPTKKIHSLFAFNFEEIRVKVNDSINVYSYYLKPNQKPKGNIFFVHGGGRNATYWVKMFEPLIDDGFAVYAADWRGAGKSKGSPNYVAVLEDMEACFKDFKKKTQLDSVKTIVYGTSVGGQLAVKIAKDNQEKINVLIVDGSLASAQQIAIDYAPFSFLKERAKKQPKRFNQLYVGYRDISDIKNMKKLIIHSVNDQVVPFHHGKSLYDNAKEPKEFWKTETAHITTLKDLPNQTIERLNKLIQ